jgi:thiamine biosynthesis lipoprotein
MLLRMAIEAMRTRFEFVVDADDEVRARAAGEAALELVEHCDARYSLFRSDSLVARINRDAGARPVKLDPEAYELLEECARLHEASEGAFDVGIGGLMRDLGFRATCDDACCRGERGAFELDPTTRAVRFTTGNTLIDLGSIAKGHALDLAAAKLRECGVERALLHGGTSSVVALGAPPSLTGWPVRIASERGAAVALRDQALSVSVARGRTANFAGHEIGHILDPRGGRPVPLELACTAIAPSAREADAWSTAALVLHARGADLAALRPHHVNLLLGENAQSGTIFGDAEIFEHQPQTHDVTR